MKAGLRARMRALRRALDAPTRARQSRLACERLVQLPEWEQARSLALYAPIRNELDCSHLLKGLRSLDKLVAYPRVLGPGLPLEFRRGELKPGTWGIPEPTGELVDPSQIDLVVVPGLAFDREGGRLGQGGGFYDRTLADMRALRVGIGFEEQLLEALPMEAWDLRMDRVVCPGGVSVAGSR